MIYPGKVTEADVFRVGNIGQLYPVSAPCLPPAPRFSSFRPLSFLSSRPVCKRRNKTLVPKALVPRQIETACLSLMVPVRGAMQGDIANLLNAMRTVLGEMKR